MNRTRRVHRVRHARSADRPSAPAGPGAFTLTIGVIVAMLVAGGVLAAFMVHERQRDQRATAIERMGDRAAAQIEELIVRTESRLAAAAGIVGVDGTVTPVQFNAFADGLATVPSIVASSLSLVVEGQDPEAFEAEHGFPIVERAADDTFRPARDRTMYVPIAVAALSALDGSRLLGLDLLNEPHPGSAIRQAWSSGRPVVSEPFSLVVGPSGFLLVQPLFEHGTNMESSTERRERVVGFISVAYDADTLADELAARVGTPVARIDFNGHVVHRDLGIDNATHSITAVALGTTWTVRFVPDVPEPAGAHSASWPRRWSRRRC
ncbi:hypothetical protein BH23ACT3_BH23ACT3_11620 [soil metagenome]